MKKRLLMTLGTAVALCALTTFQFLKADTSLLRAQETQSTVQSGLRTATSSSNLITSSSSSEKDSSAASSDSSSSGSDTSSSLIITPEPSDSSGSTPESSSGSENSSVPESSSSNSSSNTDSSANDSSESGSSSAESTEQSSSTGTDSSSSDSASSEESQEPVGVANQEEVEQNYTFSVSRNSTTQEFIDLIKKDAQEVAWDSDLYASVMIAQAILETGSGNSALSSAPNYNLFGIKGDYEGESVSFPTQEDDGSGNLYTIQSSFRKYPSVKESLEDYAKLLSTSFYRGARKSNTDSYQDATKFLTGKYATDTSYNKKLNALIETYKLTDHDVEPGTDPAAAPSEEAKASEEKAKESFKKAVETGAFSDDPEVNNSFAGMLNGLSNIKPDYSYEYSGSSKTIMERSVKEIKASESIK